MSIHRVPESPSALALAQPPRRLLYDARRLMTGYYPRPIKNDGQVLDRTQLLFGPVLGMPPYSPFGNSMPTVPMEQYLNHVNGMVNVVGLVTAVGEFMEYGSPIALPCMIQNARMIYTATCHMLYYVDYVLRVHGCGDDERSAIGIRYMKAYKKTIQDFFLHRWGVDRPHLSVLLFSEHFTTDDHFHEKALNYRIMPFDGAASDALRVEWDATPYPVIYASNEYPLPLLSFPGDTKCNPVDLQVMDTLVDEEDAHLLHGEEYAI